MAGLSTPPFQAQDPAEINALVQKLEAHINKGRGRDSFSVRKNTFQLPDGRSVVSWRMQDWDYKKPDLPTYARGLFTRRNEQSGNHEIVVRGYDKFFNNGEIPLTEWKSIKNDTWGPYELSVKENGCIIFISALDNETILVCSKHSTGNGVSTISKSHAGVGEEWLGRHLASVGKSKSQLAKTLRELNATAVAELCDDNFEEHVLAYNNDMAGLYLHGLNLNLPEFATYPHHLVDQFAQDWGLKTTSFLTEDNIDKVKAFLDQVAETGAYNGRDTEGFVIRCHSKYSHGINNDWFFKYKFEEPYLMYRQWRECTRSIIAGKKPVIRRHKQITEKYLLYARRRFIADSSLAKQFNQNHGIISLRNDFLKDQGITGAGIIRQEIESGEASAVPPNIILIPVATIGCGKTTISIALNKLFGWNEFQNDNIQGKVNRPQRFISSIVALTVESPVVFADRNNHQKREREQFITDINKIIPAAALVALNYVHNPSRNNEIRRTLINRVLNRGDKHQTIRAGDKSEQEITGIMDGFLKRFEPLDKTRSPDNRFDLVIDLDPLLPARENLETVINRLHDEYPKLFPDEMPSSGELDEAIYWAMNTYEPETKHDLSFNKNKNKNNNSNNNNNNNNNNDKKNKASNQQVLTNLPSKTAPKAEKKQQRLEYFSVRVSTTHINNILENIFSNVSPQRARMFRTLQAKRRVQVEFHVTLIHRSAASTNPAVWSKCHGLYETAVQSVQNYETPSAEPELGKCDVLLERLVWNERIMAFVVRLINDENGVEWSTVNDVAHITVGTADASIKPKESNDLLAKWISGATSGVDEEKVKGSLVLNGTVHGVLQKL